MTLEVCLAYVPEAQMNDYVIVHAGFAISQLDEEEAQHSMTLLAEARVLEQELVLSIDSTPNSDP